MASAEAGLCECRRGMTGAIGRIGRSATFVWSAGRYCHVVLPPGGLMESNSRDAPVPTLTLPLRGTQAPPHTAR
jgi:hypothetical protein